MPTNSAEYQRAYRERKKREKEEAALKTAQETGMIVGSIKDLGPADPPPLPLKFKAHVCDHTACDARIAALEAELVQYRATAADLTDALVPPPFLVAPNDDCAACGHEFHTGRCPHRTAVLRCDCSAYVPASLAQF